MPSSAMRRTRKEVFVVIVVDECFGDDAHVHGRDGQA